MKKTILSITILTAMVAVFSFNSIGSVYAYNDQPATSAIDVQLSSENLTQSEIDDLLYMHEEEKLARDVYLTLYEKWDLALFNNIATSEQRHMDAVDTLIERYGLLDSVLADVGKFTNQDLQNLYDELVAKGSNSLTDALLVGAAIEEIDILDLQDALEETVNADISRVFESLMRGSYNHLKAFTSTYNRYADDVYEPQYMTQSEYDQILTQSNQSARGRFQSNTNPGRRGGRF
jgi:hypothetical protein